MINELTTGEKRFINECTNNWEMLVQNILICMEDVPGEVLERIDHLRTEYREGFREVYSHAKETRDAPDAHALLNEYDRGFTERFPEFYQMRQLFAGCSEKDLHRARKALLFARRMIERE